MDVVEIKVKKREKLGKESAKKYRRMGLVPGVMYGVHLKENVHILIERKALWDLIKRGHSKEQHILKIIVEDGNNSVTETALLQDIQIDPLTDEPIHVDFHAVTLEEVVDVYVPVVLKGEPKGVKQGGLLQHGVEEILVRALPLDIPTNIEVDISDLDIGDAITVRDLNIPDKIKVLTPLDDVIVAIVTPQRYTEETTVSEETEGS
uniref:Large ribosomal subunit protein bL25 n=1 Tax=Dictyoglomus thermophilum TaxID=14 RepID=A0A7C3ML28_DICTH